MARVIGKIEIATEVAAETAMIVIGAAVAAASAKLCSPMMMYYFQLAGC
jgi:hypothetical protein